MCQQLVPHLESLSLLRLLFSYECFMGHPTPILLREKSSFVHSLMACQGSRGSPVHLLQGDPSGQDELMVQGSEP